MIHRYRTIFLAAGLLLASAAQAQVAVTADLGTTGAGVHLVVPMEKTLNGRFGVNGFNYNSNERSGSLDYELKASMRSVDILFDWYLLDNSLMHLTAGLVHSGNKVTGKAKPDANSKYTINGNVYPAVLIGTLDADITYRHAAPYLGIGWGNALKTGARWNLTAELGAFFQGSPKANLVAHGCTVSNGICSLLARDVDAEEAGFADDVGSFKAYPVLRVGIGYNF